jgi:hypothetical protein
MVGGGPCRQLGQGQRTLRRRRAVEVRVERLVDLVMEGEDRPGQPGEGEEDRRRQADVAVQQDEKVPHHQW